MKNALRGITLVSALTLLAAGALAQRGGARDAGQSDASVHDAAVHDGAVHDGGAHDATPANEGNVAGNWQELGTRTVNGARDRDTIRVQRRHNPLTHVLIRVEQNDIEIYDVVITFADGSTFAPQLRLTFAEGSRSRRIDLPGDARVIRKVEFRYGNLPGGGNARVELLGES